MSEVTASNIAQWFSEHDDGEFLAFDRRYPYEFIAPETDDGVIVYCTKSRPFLSVLDHPSQFDGLGIIARYGLPDARDIDLIEASTKRFPMVFLGDLDPPDLLIFSQLRLHIPRLRYFGISDAMLAAAGTTSLERLLIPQSASETAAVGRFAEIFERIEPLTGPTCARVLRDGRKVELEGTFWNLRETRNRESIARFTRSVHECAAARSS